jgi:hypothetical protein
MNYFEKLIYDTVKNNPAIKRFARNSYQSFFDIFPKPKNEIYFPFVVYKRQFFGFHDPNPFNSNDTLVLSCGASSFLSMPGLGEELPLYVNDLSHADNVNQLGVTKAWNWHMGCKLQWYGDDQVIFNDLDTLGRPVGRRISLDSGEIVNYPFHLSSVSKGRALGVGYSFARVERAMPGYGYAHQRVEESDRELCPSDSGLAVWDLSTGGIYDFLSIRRLAFLERKDSMASSFHIATHAVFSPDGENIAFIHRWVKSSNIEQRKSRLIIYNVARRELFLADTAEMVSHFCWLDNSTLVAFCSLPNKVDAFAVFNIIGTQVNIIDKAILSVDGHPSPNPTGTAFVVDSYPNRRRIQELYIYDNIRQDKIIVGKFYHPKKFQSPNIFQHWCIDLHPRWSRTGRYISIDCCFEGERSHLILDLISSSR